MLKICTDIGGTKTIVGLIDEHLAVIESQKFDTYINDPEAEFSEIMSIANKYKENYKNIDQNTLNIAMPGPCDYTKGLFLNPPNLQDYIGFNAGDYIKQHSEFTPHFVNDTDAAILAEYQYIKSKTKDIIYLTISTGIGMAYIRNGQLITGVDGNFGEIGHTIIKNDSNYQCPVCHQFGCVENELSGLAISRKASDILERKVSTREAIDIFMNKADENITRMMDEVLLLTQQLCNNLYNIFNVYHIVLGGGVTQSVLPYKEMIEDYTQKHHLIQKKPFHIKVSDLKVNVLTGLYFANPQ
ncbi:ROK family protein [Staphylococcus nepalensis]|uniref:ROK family protein n=1 Tax=Staphylococcus nepalensis TaxID=214473 RepID=A0A2T4SBA0_9STAP|nr:ROK family protein [Staphylococcus nepalensis]PTK59406.1 ROK family protein [Staphylococcus nepalensis]